MRRSSYLAEFLGTGILVAVVVGSGTMATNMSSDRGVELLINTISTVLALGILILILGPVSGAHLNPAVTLSEWAQKRLSAVSTLGYLIAQFSGGIAGVALANLMFKNPALFQSHHLRTGLNLWLGEVVATAGLLYLIQMLRGQGKLALAPVVLAGWIGSAYFFTSSTSFANPAVTLARGFTDTFSGIAPRSVPLFVLAQLIGATLGVLTAKIFQLGEDHGK
ncbi:MAG: MIP/aquaporin family protein [Actinomycetes bacterium]